MSSRVFLSVCFTASLAFGDDQPRFEGETPEQRSALDRRESFVKRELDDLTRVCRNRPVVKIDLEGFEKGDPHPNLSAASHIDSVAASYYGRCSPAIDAVKTLCDRFGEPARSLSKIYCEYAETEDGYRKGNKHCEVWRNGSVLIARCGWYQTVDFSDVCKALNGDKCNSASLDDDEDAPSDKRAPDSRPSRTAVPKEAPAQPQCKRDVDCDEGQRCKQGKCVDKPATLSGRGGPCKSSRDCHGGATCFAHKCE